MASLILPVSGKQTVQPAQTALVGPLCCALMPDELKLLLEQPEPFTDFGIRDRAILETFYSTGLRLSELFSLKVTDIDLRTGEIPIIGKGRKRRVVFLSDRAKRALKKWLDIHPASCDSLFTIVRQRNRHTKDPLSRKAIQNMVKRHCRGAGISLIHCPSDHSLGCMSSSAFLYICPSTLYQVTSFLKRLHEPR